MRSLKKRNPWPVWCLKYHLEPRLDPALHTAVLRMCYSQKYLLNSIWLSDIQPCIHTSEKEKDESKEHLPFGSASSLTLLSFTEAQSCDSCISLNRIISHGWLPLLQEKLANVIFKAVYIATSSETGDHFSHLLIFSFPRQFS